MRKSSSLATQQRKELRFSHDHMIVLSKFMIEIICFHSEARTIKYTYNKKLILSNLRNSSRPQSFQYNLIIPI